MGVTRPTTWFSLPAGTSLTRVNRRPKVEGKLYMSLYGGVLVAGAALLLVRNDAAARGPCSAGQPKGPNGEVRRHLLGGYPPPQLPPACHNIARHYLFNKPGSVGRTDILTIPTTKIQGGRPWPRLRRRSCVASQPLAGNVRRRKDAHQPSWSSPTC